MTLGEKKLLLDIETSIASIGEHLNQQRDFVFYLNNKTVRRAVERGLEIIGEATNNLLKLNAQIQISNARAIVNLRNTLIHAYDNVNDTVVWGIVMDKLPVLEKEIKTLITSA
jgi:uncharacterized protein with HEPN domain